MSIRKTTDKDIIKNVINIGLRMYGNGHSYSRDIIDYISEYCRQQLRYYFIKYNQLIISNNRISFINILVYTSRHKKDCLKRLQQFVQAKDRSQIQQEELNGNIIKDKKLNINNRFLRICHQLKIDMNENKSILSTLDDQRLRQYARLDGYYKSDTLTSNDYLLFIEQQHTSFNNFRSLSSIDIMHWLNLNNLNFSKQDLRLADICLFLIKEILLNLMDNIYQSSIPCQINDVLRRQHVYKNYRLPFSGRRRRIH